VLPVFAPDIQAFVITIPPKIWRPKPKCRYRPPLEYHDVDSDIILFSRYGRALSRPTHEYRLQRTDLIVWDPLLHQVITLSPSLDPRLHFRLTTIIQRHWDAFASDSVCRPVLDYEFHIDTGDAKPIACRPPRYGIHESAIIMEQIAVTRHNGWTRPCPQGGWAAMIELPPKLHQEAVIRIHEFIWRMCVSYRPLNAVTAPFEFPIPRCDEALDNFAPGAGCLYWISLDAKSSYHQIAVYWLHREKLAFILPDNTKETFDVMPFGPKNAPACYTVLIYTMRAEWTALFVEKYPDLNPALITVSEIRYGDRQIVDDILLYCNDPVALTLYFECVCMIFVKFRLSFNPMKCEFFIDRIEWIGYDLRSDGNSPASP